MRVQNNTFLKIYYPSALTFRDSLDLYLEAVFFFNTPLVTDLSNSLKANDKVDFASSTFLASTATRTF